MLQVLLSLLLEIQTAAVNVLTQTQSSLSGLVPSFLGDNNFLLAASLTSVALALPVLYLLFSVERKPHLPPRMSLLLPLLKGKLKLTERGPLETVRLGYEQFGEIFRLRIFHQGITVMLGPEASQVVFEAADKDFSQKEVYGFTVPVFGPNIVYDAPEGVMVQQLKFVRHSLMGAIMKTHVEKIVDETVKFFAAWPEAGTIDLKQSLSELTILTASRCLLGQEVREHLHSEVADLYECLNKGMTQISFFMPRLPTKAHRNRDNARKKIVEIFSRVIRQRREDEAKGLVNDDNKPNDMLQMLIDARYRDGRELNEEEISGLLLAALFAGQHTSSITSTWVGMMVLSKKAELFPRLLEEQKEVLARHNGELTIEALNDMVLLHACVKETLRLFPPLILLMRKVNTDTPYKNYIIPKGDIVVCSPPVSHRIPEVYPNPEEFDPDRFVLRDEGSDKFAFIAFGQGRHTCLGTSFAFMQVKTIWSVLLRQFDFTLPKPFVPVVDFSSLVAAPGNDCHVLFKRKPADEVF